MTPNKIFIDTDLIAFHVLNEKHEGDIEYVRKDPVAQVIRGYLDNWLDPYKIERLIDKIEEL